MDAPLQLLLFIDRRVVTAEQVQQIRGHLQRLQPETSEINFDLKIIDVGEQPYLAEHFRLVATPALLKISPPPRQTLAGRNLLAQLDSWWPRWQRELSDLSLKGYNPAATSSASPDFDRDSLRHSVELIQLADEVFRLKQDNEALQDQLQFKDQIISMLAHDLRNPLTAAAIALETLEGQWEPDGRMPPLPPEMLQRLVQHARTQTQVIERMITNLLLAARGRSAELTIQPKRLNLKLLCQEVLDDSSSTFKQRQQQLATDIPGDLPFALADGDRVRQVIVNLLENASKYTPTGGLIQLSILHRTTQKIQVSVCDNGPGIPPENCEKIFEDEFRLKRDQHLEGYGLGLALCRRIIRAHYGHIWVDSTLGQGSCFHFTLPVYQS